MTWSTPDEQRMWMILARVPQKWIPVLREELAQGIHLEKHPARRAATKWLSLGRAKGRFSSTGYAASGARRSPPGLPLLLNRIPPSPAPGADVVRLGTSGHGCDGDTTRGAEFCPQLGLGDIRLRQHAGGMPRDRHPRQRDIAEFFVLIRQFGALDLLMRA